MNKIQISLLVALAPALSGLALAQNDPPPLPTTNPEKPEKSALKPGVLPEGTSIAAKMHWEALTAATLVAGVQRQPVTSFRLLFDLRVRTDESSSNDVHATYSFLAEKNYVRFTLQSGREQFRGPDGDFSVDGEGKTIPLKGREDAEDRRQIDEAARIAKNFVALTDPGRLRIARLSTAVEAPPGLPKSLEKRAKNLIWLEVVSPDFHLSRAGISTSKKERIFRVLLGLDPKTHRIDLAELREVGRSRTEPILIRFDNYMAMDGFQIPRQLQLFELAPGPRQRMFRNEPTSDLYLRADQGTLRANLTPEDFKP